MLHRITRRRVSSFPEVIPGRVCSRRSPRYPKERGFTQVELAEKVDMIQALISDYERDKLRPYADVVARFAVALDVTTDQLLGVTNGEKKQAAAPNRRLLRRLQLIDRLPKRDQEALLRTIDAFIGKTGS